MFPPMHADKYAIAQWLTGLIAQHLSPPFHGVEVGVRQGELASLLLADERLSLLLVDRWAPAPPDSSYRTIGDPAACATAEQHRAWKAEALERTAFAGKRAVIWHGESAAAAHAAATAGRVFDLVFLDADHSYEGRRADLCDWYPLVRSGGLVAGGLLRSAYGGDCGARALEEFRHAHRVAAPLLTGPAQTWAFVRT